MLLERNAEVTALHERLAATARGEGGVVLIEGPAGLGKSSLARALRADAEAAGLLTRTAIGGELEREYPFGLARQLFEPLLRQLPGAERDGLLAGAAAIAAPVLGLSDVPDAPATVDASFAKLHGLYWLAAGLAERQPLVLLVDDAHWGDAPSLRFLDFLGRRASELALLVVVALRPGESPEAGDLLAGLADAPSAVTLRPRVLSEAATATLVSEGLGETVADDVIDAAHEATGGNPLLLRELIRTLAAWDGEPSAEVVRAALPSSVSRSVQRRLRRLDPSARRSAGALALLGQSTPRDVVAVAAGLSAVEVDAAVEALHAVSLVDGDPPRFVHPLLRQAVAEALTPAERTALHHRAARELHTRAGMHKQAVAQLLAAPPLHEPWVLDLLRAEAARNRVDGAPELAVRRLRRAMEVVPTDDSQLRDVVSFELASAEIGVGDSAAIERLDSAARAEDPVVAASAIALQLGLGLVTDREGAERVIDRGSVLLTRLRDAGHDALHEELHSALLNVTTLDPWHAHVRAELLELARRRPRPQTSHLIAYEAVLGDLARNEALDAVRQAVDAGVALGVPGLEGGVPTWTVVSLLALDEQDLLHGFMREMRRVGRRGGSQLSLAFGDYTEAMVELHGGSVARAEALAREAHTRFAEFGGAVLEVSSRALIVDALVLQGRLDEAETLVCEVPDAFEGRRLVMGTWLTSRAELRVAQGRPQNAIADLERVEELCAAFGWKRFVLGRGPALMARALIAVGRVDDGRARAEVAVADARGRGVAHHETDALLALARAQRGPAQLDTLAAAVLASQRTNVLRVKAEALLEYGAALRRANRRSDARPLLAQAREIAHRAEATALLRAATEELAVAGGRPRRIALSGVEALTPSERRVAENAAAGLTNREIAETLFVTRKTVELHLGNAYAKLGIRSRTQLAEALAT